MTDAEAQALIDSLDLDYALRKARAENDWSVEQTRDAERRYRDFLYVCWHTREHRTEARIVMTMLSRSADQVWHHHILVTPEYRRDCEAIFGEGAYLDHVPLDYPVTEIYGKGHPAAQARTEQYYAAAGKDHPKPGQADYTPQACAWQGIPRG